MQEGKREELVTGDWFADNVAWIFKGKKSSLLIYKSTSQDFSSMIYIKGLAGIMVGIQKLCFIFFFLDM